ncbi:MAG: pyridoxal phosphate-dependent aminotransferase [Desulfocapsaceae bacterium]|jgi:aspartate/methionine/tyrosine aminotransferase|nr:pyridoxal phosphate-dependent aminotransferase [Desulfocapsaceae bacterium]
MAIAQRMEAIPFSGIRKVFEEIIRREKDGDRIIHLEIGRPDFDTPGHIKEKAKWALDEGLVHYTSNAGLSEFRMAIAEKLQVDNGLNYRAADEIIVTNGANEAVFIAMMALLNPGDEVLVPSPCWTHYYQCARLSGALPVAVPLRKENNYLPMVADLEQHVSPRCRMLVINTPHNPTGAVYERACLEELADFAQRHDLLVLSDEIYEKLIYGDAEHLSFASIAGMFERTVTVNGLSKIYAMTGWRLGYTAASRVITEAMLRVHQYTSVCATTFAQYGGVAALNGPQECVEKMVGEFGRRRVMVCERLKSMKGVRLVVPHGAFYTLPDISELGIDPQEFALYLLDEAKIAVVPGAAFGDHAEATIRISYANSYENLEEAMDRMELAIEKL